MIDYLRRILTNNEPLARCSRCRHLWPLSELEDGLCPDCRTEEDDDD